MVPPERIRRASLLLAAAQVALWGAIGAFATFGPIAVKELSGQAGGAATLFGLYYLGAAAGAVLAGRLMDRAGRRPGLVAGYLVLTASGGVSAWAVAAGHLVLLSVSGIVLGAGVGAALLGRGAVADMYAPERRGRAVGLLVVAGTAGAVGGPPLAGLVHSITGALWAPFLLVVMFGFLAAGLVASLRPDPRDLAFEIVAPGPRRRPAEVLRSRPAVVAVVAIGTAQAVMVTFMSVLPVVVHDHGASELAVSLVVSAHLGAMFLFSPLIGAAVDRWGRRPGLLGGLLFTAAGVGLSLAVEGILADSAGLFLIGVGWSAAYVSSTAVLSDLATPAERAGTLGLGDLAAAASAGVAVLGAAALIQGAGFTALATVALVLLAGAAVPLLALRERGVAGAPT